MQADGYNYFAVATIDGTTIGSFTVTEHPAGGWRAGNIDNFITFDNSSNQFILVNPREQISSNTTLVIEGYKTSNGTTFTHFQFDTNLADSSSGGGDD